jgi:glycosyltransferase involved in cell wall biosynthesis
VFSLNIGKGACWLKKVDLVMWAKNGAKTLPYVLKRIDEVIPCENVCHKILVDDHSTDQTVGIAKNFNWEVYPNPEGGIPRSANEALKHVDCDYFVSVEQDVLLARDWWDKIPKFMTNEKVAVAQGIRISTEPTLKKLDEYFYSRLNFDNMSDLAHKRDFGYSIDNNIFRTKIIRQLGGFPTLCRVCCDTILIKKILLETEYTWIIDREVVSYHIQKSVKNYIQHFYALSGLCARTPYCVPKIPHPLLTQIRLLLTSPLGGLKIAYSKKCPNMLWVTPQIRSAYLKFLLRLRRAEKC